VAKAVLVNLDMAKILFVRSSWQNFFRSQIKKNKIADTGGRLI
jgi:hypothetical protein